MLKQLMLIRNDIEHNDAPSPNIERCQELLDLTWYFLKSTDSFVSLCKHDFILKKLSDSGDETQYWLNFDIDFEQGHTTMVNGWVPETLLSKEEKQGFTLIELKDFGSKEARWGGSQKHTDKLDNDFWINGKLKPSENTRFEIVKRCLHANM
ncbi:hypothetical protein [Psychrobacter sp. AOP7-A1-24]|uniref:hypothetical protein n=1 Tax=Psychrobacter sp. AOP7-A1-24 TaxID=3457646 RepID=UPI00402B2E02